MFDKDEVKARLGQEARYIILSGLGLQEKGGKINCPFHQDKEPSMSWFKEGLMFRCHACGEQMDIYRYLEDFKGLEFREAVEEVARMVGEDVDMNVSKRVVKREPIIATPKKFVKPQIKQYELSEEALDYMNLRGIKKETLDHWNVKQTNKHGEERYVFNYYDEKGELVYVSYRHIGKASKNGHKGGCEANTKAILWGMDKIDKEKPVVITEGQPDAMIVWQSGYKNVVSVPSGSNNFTWIDNCWDWLQGVEEIIVWADNDAPGLKMAKSIQRKLKNVKILVTEHKDANVMHFKEGEDAVRQAIENKINETPQGIIDLSQIRYKSKLESEDESVESGFAEIDRHVRGFKMGEISVVFGRNGEGKTTFISQSIAHSIENNQKLFLYNGELSEQKMQEWIYNQVVGSQMRYKQAIEGRYGTTYEVRPAVAKAIKEWHKGLLYMYDNNYHKDGEYTHDLLLETMSVAARRYDIDVFIIDNLMSVLETNDSSINSDQSNFVQNLKNFAVKHNVHVVLVAHPNKNKTELIEEDEESGNLEKTDVSGSNNIPNKADNIIAVERYWSDEHPFDAVITVLKDRETGQRKSINFLFDQDALRFFSKDTRLDKEYSWKQYYKPEIHDLEGVGPEDCPF